MNTRKFGIISILGEFVYSANSIFRSKIRYMVAKLSVSHEYKIILCYPQVPKHFHVLYKVCHELGYRVTNDISANADLVIHFEDVTQRQYFSELDTLNKTHRVLNINCQDISKKHVDEVFSQIFHYSIMINPKTYEGKCVMKSDTNAAHDGKIITSPINPKPGYVYQRIVNNEYDNQVLDFRVPIIGGTIPFIYKKYRPLSYRFSNTNASILCVNVSNIFSSDETKAIINFCKTIGLDIGELDILRDKNSGKLYIVDVNNTPAGPPNSIRPKEYHRALSLLSTVFSNTYL